jgi:hypothetical protein
LHHIERRFAGHLVLWLVKEGAIVPPLSSC